jgi:methyltransferase (TIGR00027 family)
VQEGKPSATAWRAALGRAAHQFFDTPKVFDDPLALRIVGAHAPGTTPDAFFRDRYKPTRRSTFVRALLAVRSRLAEDELASAVGRGVRQYVLLGAGLDTFAYRSPHPGLRVFEVDHPATQAWKREILGRARIAEPASLTFVPARFDRQTPMDALADAGFDRSAPAFFAWLGVTMYVEEETVYSTLREVGSARAGSGIVFDYNVARAEMSLLSRLAIGTVNRRLKRIGEPWITFLAPTALTARLGTFGFRDIRDLGAEDLNARFFTGRSDRLRLSPVGRVMIASV